MDRTFLLVPSWEYKRVIINTTSIYDDNLIKEFNTHGQDGWELVSYYLVPIYSPVTGLKDAINGIANANCICIFKKLNYEQIELTNKQQSDGNQD